MTQPWLFHGVVAADAPRPDDAPAHERASVGALAALISPAALSGDPDADAAEAMRHHALLVAQAALCPVVPARFGAAVSGRDAAIERLRANAEAWTAALERIGDGVEVALRIVRDPVRRPIPPTAAPAPVDGRAWLRARAAARDGAAASATGAQADAAALVAALAVYARASARGPARADPARLADVALLVDRDRLDALRDHAERLTPTAAAAGLGIELRGPWPAYSFAAGEAAP